MDQATCTFCQTLSPLHFRVSDLNRRLSNELFAYYRCPECHLLFLSPHPADLGKYYPKEYYGATRTLNDLVPELDAERYKVAIVQQFARAGRLLEVGPSRGLFAYLAKESGFTVSAVERDPECCRFLSEVLGIEAINDLDTARVLDRQPPFDVITLWQVIEHLDDPWGFVRAAAANLKPGGYLIIGTPNPDSFQYRLFGRFWAHLDAPRHLQLIPASLLVKLGASVGLRQVLLNTTGDGDADRCNLFGWQQSMVNALRGGTPTPLIEKNMGRIGYRLRLFEQRRFRGTTYTLVLQKNFEI